MRRSWPVEGGAFCAIVRATNAREFKGLRGGSGWLKCRQPADLPGDSGRSPGASKKKVIFGNELIQGNPTSSAAPAGDACRIPIDNVQHRARRTSAGGYLV